MSFATAKSGMCDALRVFVSVLFAAAVSMLPSTPAVATVFGNVRGVVHDPQHEPVKGAHATLQAADSAYQLTADTAADGEFHFDAVPLPVHSELGVSARRAVDAHVPGLDELPGLAAGAEAQLGERPGEAALIACP